MNKENNRQDKVTIQEKRRQKKKNTSRMGAFKNASKKKTEKE